MGNKITQNLPQDTPQTRQAPDLPIQVSVFTNTTCTNQRLEQQTVNPLL